MNRKKTVFGAVLLILGALIAIGPQSIFAVCEFNPEKAMRCHWMAQAELGVGAVMAVLGLCSMLSHSAQLSRGLLAAGSLLGILTMLLPTVLIGVCMNAHMQCAALTRPALLVLGAAAVLAGALGAWMLRDSER